MSIEEGVLILSIVAPALLVSAVIVLGLFLARRRFRSRMVEVEHRMEHLQREIDALKLPLQVQQIESTLRRGENEGKIDSEVAERLREYLADLHEEIPATDS